MSKVWTEIKQGNPFQALKAFFGFSTKSDHVVMKAAEEPKLPRVNTPALTKETIMEVEAGIAASKEAMKAKQQEAVAKRRATSWKPGLSTTIEETGKELGFERRAAKKEAKALKERNAKEAMDEIRALEEAQRLVTQTSSEPTRPKTKEEQSKEDKAKAADHKKKMQERSRAAAVRAEEAKKEKTKVKKVKLTQDEAQSPVNTLLFLTAMNLATIGDQVEPEKKVKKIKQPKQSKGKHSKREIQRSNQTQSKGRDKHR